MSSPVNGGGRPTVLPVSGESVLLTEFAVAGQTLYVINPDPSATGLVYVGNDSGVGPSSGVPLEGGTALPWTAGGEVWAALAPGSPEPVSVVITSAIGGWNPSPVAIAAALADEGIPNVFTLTDLGTITVPMGGAPVALDVHGYASLIITGNFGGVLPLSFYWSDDEAGADRLGPTDQLTAAASMNVRDSFLQLVNTTTTNLPVHIFGSNRDLPADNPVVAAYSSSGWVASTGTQTMSLGQYGLTTSLGGPFQGPAYLYWRDEDATVQGILYAEVGTINSILAIADTSQLNANVAGIGRSASQMIALPANLLGLKFVCTANPGTAKIDVSLIPAY